MAGLKLQRWVFSWLCQWFPGRVHGRRRPAVYYVKPTLDILEDRASPTSLSGAMLGIAPPPYPA